MHRLLLGLAGLAATLSTPAHAADGAFIGGPRVDAGQFARPSVLNGAPCRDVRRDFRRERDRRFEGRRFEGRRFDRCRSDVLMDWYGGEWALFNNRSWSPDSYNDWWHDRPDRAYPAWMRRNRDCQRQWFSGDVLTC